MEVPLPQGLQHGPARSGICFALEQDWLLGTEGWVRSLTESGTIVKSPSGMWLASDEPPAAWLHKTKPWKRVVSENATLAWNGTNYERIRSYLSLALSYTYLLALFR